MYIVLELQTNKDGSVGSLINNYSQLDQAESKYHAILSSAAISNVPVHTAVIMDEYGMDVRSQSYKHDVSED